MMAQKIYPDLYKREADDDERAPSPFTLLDATIDAFGEAKSAEQLCEIDNAQIFYIHGEHTSVPSYPTPLKIFRFLGGTCIITLSICASLSCRL